MDADWFVRVTGGSETGLAARSVDWAATSLGVPSRWPVPLRTATELCFSTRFPLLVTWGPDLVMVYNDGYAEMLGTERRLSALGRPTREVWAEIWDDVAPLFAQVTSTGEPTWSSDQLLLVHRDGLDEEAYFTFSYSALRDDAGAVAGVMDIVTETTRQVVDRRRLTLLGELSTRLHEAARDVEDVGRVTIDVLGGRGTDVTAADLHLLDRDELLLLATTRPRSGGGAVSADVLLHVARTRAAVEVGSTLVAPLVVTGDDAAAGVVVLESSPLRPYDAGYRQFLDLVAASVGTAMSAAVRHEREVGGLRQVSEALQLSMLPEVSGVPGVATRYLPAVGSLTVGGDWFDVLPLSGGRLAVVVGDCVGHGLAAAAVMGQLRSATRALLLEDHGPAATLDGLDRFAASLPGAEFTSVFCGVADPVAGTLTYSRAGHPPPALLRGGEVRWLDGGAGSLLTVLTAPHRTETVAGLSPDDTLVAFTDGLVERRRESLSTGLRRLADALEAADPVVTLPRLADDLLDHLLPDGAADDVALVVHRAA